MTLLFILFVYVNISLHARLVCTTFANVLDSCTSRSILYYHALFISPFRRLSTWQDVNFLAKYPHLRVLRLSTIPLFTGRGSSEVRPEVIGRIPQLAFFNGSQITPRERSESEKNYLRAILFERNARLAAVAAAAPSVAPSAAPSAKEPADHADHKVREASDGAAPTPTVQPKSHTHTDGKEHTHAK